MGSVTVDTAVSFVNVAQEFDLDPIIGANLTILSLVVGNDIFQTHRPK